MTKITATFMSLENNKVCVTFCHVPKEILFRFAPLLTDNLFDLTMYYGIRSGAGTKNNRRGWILPEKNCSISIKGHGTLFIIAIW